MRPRHARGKNRSAHRWGKTKAKIGFHGGEVEIERPRLRSFDDKEQALPSWERATTEGWLGKWAMNQLLIDVSTRKFKRSVRLPEGESAGTQRFWPIEVGRLPAFCRAVGSATEGMDGA